jgi:hypothetical protein
VCEWQHAGEEWVVPPSPSQEAVPSLTRAIRVDRPIEERYDIHFCPGAIRSEQEIDLAREDHARERCIVPLALDVSLYKLLQVLGVTLFERTPTSTVVLDVGSQFQDIDDGNQLNLFDL